jgi:pimeloyl-ACP methyl ester carboxylesterase
MADADVRQVFFDAHRTTDALGRTIRYYVSFPRDRRLRSSLPLAVWIQGSGCHSLFRIDDAGRLCAGYHNVLRQVAEGRMRVLAVEKPGVRFLDWPGPQGTAQACRAAFLREHTLTRWVTALEAALTAATRADGIVASPCLAVGHSEGALVAAALARNHPQVSHVALLGGSGVNQLYEIANPRRLRRKNTRTEAEEVFATWMAIRGNPNSTGKFAWGHPYRRWSSFLATSTIEQLRGWKGRVYAVHGTADRAVPIESFDVLVAELLAGGADLVSERLAGRDHSFRRASGSTEMSAILQRVVTWATI